LPEIAPENFHHFFLDKGLDVCYKSMKFWEDVFFKDATDNFHEK